jgi:hypothetical protein
LYPALCSCARLAICTYLSPSTPTPSQQRCILCKVNYPTSMFESSNSPACLPITAANNAQQTEIIEMPPRVCCWHVSRLARVVQTGSYVEEKAGYKTVDTFAGKSCSKLRFMGIKESPGTAELCNLYPTFSETRETGPGGRNEWVSQMDKWCMHCGELQGREKCNCRCDSCSFRTVRTYTRYLNNKNECRRFQFWREAPRPNESQGKLWVRETGWAPRKLA